jgi:hypothetical protein
MALLIPIAASGRLVIGVAVVGAIVLMVIVLRMES